MKSWSWIGLALTACGLAVAVSCRKPPRPPPPPAGAACGEAPGDEVPVPGGEVVVHLETEPAHLNNLIQPEGWRYRVTLHIHEPLVREDPGTGAYVPGLAERWEVSNDKLTYTFHLRAGVRWHDGQPFSSRDAAFTFDKIFGEAPALRGGFEPFGCRHEAPDERTFRLVCKKPYFMMLANLDGLPILPAHAMGDGDLNKHPLKRRPLGTGPYKFDHWTPGSEIVLARNDDYWGKKAYLDRIVYLYVENPVTAVQLAAKGELDFVSRVREPQWVGMVKTDPKIRANFREIVDWPNQYSYLSFNCGGAMFSDARVRRAMAHLFDADRILKDLMYGMGKRIATVYHEKSPGFHDGLLPYPFDPDRAKQLFDETGWKDTDGDGVRDKDGKPFRFTFLMSVGSATLEKQITVYQEDLRKAGIRMDVTKIEFAQFLDRAGKHDFDMLGLGNTEYSPRMDPYFNYHSSQIEGGQNWSGYANPDMDALLDTMRVELDEQKRAEIDRRIQELAYEDLPYVPAFTQPVPAIVHKRFCGVKTSVEWYQLNQWWIPKRLQGQAH